MTWVLILMLYQPLDRLETTIPVSVPFASYDACWLAGYRVSQLEDLNLSSKPPAKRIAWECVPTARPDLAYCDSCGMKAPNHFAACPEHGRRRGMERLAAELRETIRGNRERFEREHGLTPTETRRP